MAKKKNEWLYRALCAALAVTLVSGMAVMSPVADIVGTNITANAATTVSDTQSFLTAVANGGEIVLGADITVNQSVTISKACTIDFNGKTITFNGDNVNLTVQAPTTLKNGTLTSSYTNDPRFHLLVACADTVAENMTISQPENKGASWIVEVTSPKFTMIDSTITYIATYNRKATRGINVTNQGVLLFYGNNKINATDVSFIGDSYFYSGTLETNLILSAYKAKKVYFCGGAVKNTAGKVFDSLSAGNVILQNDGDDYALYSDEAYTNPITATQVLSATAIYSKKVNKYTVTWLDNDGTTSLGTSAVTEGRSPVYDGETEKTVNGKEYRIKGWKDNNGTYYANGSLPTATGDVTYTAVYAVLVETFEPFDTNKKLTSYTGEHFQISCDNGGDEDGIVLVPGAFAAMVSSTDETKITKLVATRGYFDSPDRILASAGTRTINGNVATFTDINDTNVTLYGSESVQVKHIDVYYMTEGYTVTWKDGETTLGETDVATGKSPVYDGETPTKDSTAQYNYTFAGWTSDGGTTVYTAETLPAVTQNVTYTAVFDAELITYPFSIDKSAGGVTFEIADHESNPVAIDNKLFSAPIGSKITSSAELVFDGAEVTAETSENSYVYTIKSVSKDSVTVSRKKVAVTELTVTADNQTYTGNALTPVIVKDGETVLTENTDYTVVYTDNVNAGTATAKITGADTYITGETTVNFTIAKKNIASLAVSFDLDGDGTEYAPETYTADSSKPSIIYDGKEYTPTAKLLFSNEEVPTDSYEVSMNPTLGKNAGTYTFTFTAKENTNFTGTRTFEWNINKANMNITMTDGLEFNRVGKEVAGECVDESKFAVTGVPDGSTVNYVYFSEQGLQLPKVPTEAGNYIVKAVVTNDNYNDGEATATFTIISNQSGDYYFLKTANNTMLITGYAGDSAEAVIPETINGLPVTGIYYYAFEDSDITSVTIPESVDMIYSYAFKNAKKLTDVYYKGSKTDWNKEVTISNGNNLLKNATIHYALPENIYLDQNTLETTVNKSIRLLVSVSPVGTPADFTWTSSDETVATVDENGNVTTLDFGTATITATADNGKTAVCEVTVGHNGSNGIFEYTVSDEKEVTITKYIGTSGTVDVTEKIDDMPVIAIADGTFTDTSVKTINYSGSKTMWEELFTGKLAEDVTVNYALPTSISLNAAAEVTKADTITLTPTVTPKDTETSFTWTSADETIATVDENGVVKGVAYGTVNITATADNGQTATCAVTVTNKGVKDGFEYEIVDDKITITKYNGSAEEVAIPEKINEMPVTAIGAEAFKDNETMKDVIILLNVETIGNDAFAGCDENLNIHGYRRTDSERYAQENNVNFVAIPYPLKNASTISSKHTDVNEKVTLTGVGVEGTLEYTYAVYYKLTDEEKWTVKQNYNANNVVELSLAKEGTYNVCIKVKDTDGKVAKKYFVLYVTQPLANTSSISDDTIILGESFTVNMSAKDGSDTYKYAVYMKKVDQTAWTQVQGYADSESITVTPEEAGLYNVCVKAKDSFGTISKKYFIVNVKNVAPQNISTISAQEINVSESLTIHCDAELGAGSFRYAVYTKNVQDSQWKEIQKFDDISEITAEFEKPGLYQICVKAKDADNTIAKKYFTVTVTKDTLVNNSTISADEIMLGESIEVNAVSEGGFGAHTYAFYYKPAESSKWTTVQKFTDNAQVAVTPKKAGRYDICAKVMDQTGEIVKKYFTATVKNDQLINTSTVSAMELKLNDVLNITAGAEGGSGAYEYAVYMKSTDKSSWKAVQSFGEQSDITVKFEKNGAYDICIKVMDDEGTVAKKYLTVIVK